MDSQSFNGFHHELVKSLTEKIVYTLCPAESEPQFPVNRNALILKDHKYYVKSVFSTLVLIFDENTKTVTFRNNAGMQKIKVKEDEKESRMGTLVKNNSTIWAVFNDNNYPEDKMGPAAVKSVDIIRDRMELFINYDNFRVHHQYNSVMLHTDNFGNRLVSIDALGIFITMHRDKINTFEYSLPFYEIPMEHAASKDAYCEIFDGYIVVHDGSITPYSIPFTPIMAQ